MQAPKTCPFMGGGIILVTSPCPIPKYGTETLLASNRPALKFPGIVTSVI